MTIRKLASLRDNDIQLFIVYLYSSYKECQELAVHVMILTSGGVSTLLARIALCGLITLARVNYFRLIRNSFTRLIKILVRNHDCDAFINV